MLSQLFGLSLDLKTTRTTEATEVKIIIIQVSHVKKKEKNK